MINFFKKLRRENINSNYLKYAVGEIFLVVIGILIALWINNVNEQRKENTQLRGYLSAIQKNLQSDTVAIKRQDRTYKANQQIADAYLRNLFTNQYPTDTLFMAFNALAEQYLRIDQSGFEALKSSGYVSKLQGLEIEEKLFQYYYNYDKLLEQEKSQNNFIESMESKLFDMESEILINAFRMFNVTDIKNTGELTQSIPEITKELYTNSHVIGILQRTADENSKRYELLLANAVELLDLIDSELNN